MQQHVSRLYPFRWWILFIFIFSNSFIGGNSLLSSDESGDLSTMISETIISVGREILPPVQVEIIPATSVTLTLRNGGSTIYIGTSNRITAAFLPENTTDKTITWTTSDIDIIEVTNGGIAVARNFGTATITATSKTENVIGTITIDVIDFPLPTDFDIQAYIGEVAATVIEKDTSAKIRLENVLPTNAKFEGIIFSSSNPAIATINDDGVVVGVSPGEILVTATLGNIQRTLNLQVKDEVAVIVPTRLILNTEPTIYVGRPQTIDVDLGPVTPTDTQVTFKSSNPMIAKVNDQGVITPVNYAGYQSQTVTITAYVNANPTLTNSLILTIAKVFPTELSIRVNGEVEVGRTITIIPTFTPLDTTDRQLTYTTSDPSLATVSSGGDVGIALGQAVGRVTITARSIMDPSITTTLQLEIIPASVFTPDVVSGIYLFVRKGIGHIGLNFINGFIGFVTFYAFLSHKKYQYFYMSLLAGVALGFIFEILQFFAPGRMPAFLDVIYNVIGYSLAQILLFGTVMALKKHKINIKD
jgi:uncharacterized protein YjdB/VanZ family protein